MKRIISIMLSAVLIMVFFSGCGSGKKTDLYTSEQQLIDDTKEPVELTVWAAEEDCEMVEGWIQEFEEKYSMVDFDITISPESEMSSKDTVLTDPVAAADVFSFAADQFDALYRGGALHEITIDNDVITEECGGEKSEAIKYVSRKGGLYAYPATADNGYFMFYDKSFFTEEDVKSLDTMLDKAAKAGKKVAMQFDSGWYTLSFFVGAGFNLSVNESGDTNIFWNKKSRDGIDGREVVDAMLAIAKHDGFLSCEDAEFVTGVSDGSIVAGVSGTWNADICKASWGDGYAAACLPQYTVAGKSVQMGSVAGYKFFGVNQFSKNPEWAMLMAEFFTDYEHQLDRFNKRGAGPVNIKAAASEEVIADPAIAALAKQSQYALIDGCEGANYWTPAHDFGMIILQKNPENIDSQDIIDDFVSQVKQRNNKIE